jgi:hypothetical protein
MKTFEIGDLLTHPQNGRELRMVVAVSVIRGEAVMKVQGTTGDDWPMPISLWITQKGWSPIASSTR